MRRLASVLAVLTFVQLQGTSIVSADTIEDVRAAMNALNRAFEKQDAAAIERMTTPNHLATKPYLGTPQSVAEEVESLPELTIRYFDLTDIKITLVSPDAAVATHESSLSGTFKGKPIAESGLRI